MSRKPEDLSVSELTQLLAKKMAEEKEKNTPKALPIEEVNWFRVHTYAQQLVKNAIDDTEDDDDKHYMYEEVLNAVFGKGVFDKLNKIREQNYQR